MDSSSDPWWHRLAVPVDQGRKVDRRLIQSKKASAPMEQNMPTVALPLSTSEFVRGNRSDWFSQSSLELGSSVQRRMKFLC